MPEELLFGIEEELLIFAPDCDPAVATDRALDAISSKTTHAECHEYKLGVFVQNGARVKKDCSHLEVATAEARSPRDLVAGRQANDRLIHAAVSQGSLPDDAAAPISLGRATVDPLTSASYGFHENYLCARAPCHYARMLIAFLATRTVWAGAGGLKPGTLRFSLAPRLLSFTEVASKRTQGERPILNLRDEPLSSSGSHRLHLISGTSPSSELTLYLLAGFTSLVIRCADLGARPPLELTNPVAVLHAVADDAGCRALLDAEGRRLTAVQIQAEYLAMVEKHLDALPEWAPDVCRRMREVLEALSVDPMALAGKLDWIMKYVIWRAETGRLGAFPEAAGLLEELHSASQNTVLENSQTPLELLLGPSSPVLCTVARLNAELRCKGWKWTQLKRPAALRARLAEILDIRFGLLGEQGIFENLDRQGVLSHRVVTEPEILRAMVEGPPGTRAALRSAAIRELAVSPERAGVSAWWTYVRSDSRGLLDLSDPFEQNARWR